MADNHAVEQRIGKELVKSIIAVFLGVALGLKTDSLKDVLVASMALPGRHIWENPDVLLTLLFFFTWFSFFLGANYYMGQPPASSQAWRVDLTATIVTLCIIVVLGAAAKDQTKSYFLWWLFGLYAFEFVWESLQIILSKCGINTTTVPLFWYIFDPLLALFTVLFLIFPSWPLWVLVFGHLVYSFVNLYKLA